MTDFILDRELKEKIPLQALPDGTMIYRKFAISKSQDRSWLLSLRQPNVMLHGFNLKVCAVMAAHFYSRQDYCEYNKIKNLDSVYQKHCDDCVRFRSRCTNTKDLDLKDMYSARYAESQHRSLQAKLQIISRFKTLFTSSYNEII